jgi:hypothetical protein
MRAIASGPPPVTKRSGRFGNCCAWLAVAACRQAAARHRAITLDLVGPRSVRIPSSSKAEIDAGI